MHWNTLLRNVLSNWVSYLVTAVIGFLLAPLIVHSLGKTGYGLWSLVLSLTGYFGLLDLGIRSSVGRFVARHAALDNDLDVNRTVSTAFFMLLTGGVLALVATTLVVVTGIGRFHLEPEYADSARIALLITGLNMSCILPLSVFSAVLIAFDRFDVVSGITMFCELMRAALVIASLRLGYSLPGLALVTLIVTAIQYSAMFLFVGSVRPQLRIRPSLASFGVCRELFSFGIFRFVWVLAMQLIFYSDAMVIGMFLNAAAIAEFSVAGTLISYGRNAVSLMTDTLYPTATRLHAKEDLLGLQRLLIMGTTFALMTALPICIGLIFLGRQFIVLWMGDAYASSAVILTILALPQFASMSQYATALILAGMAKHRIPACLVLAEGVCNIILSILLVRKLGLVGIALGTVIPHVLFAIVIIPLYALRTLHLGIGEYLLGAYVRPLICAFPAALADTGVHSAYRHLSGVCSSRKC